MMKKYVVCVVALVTALGMMTSCGEKIDDQNVYEASKNVSNADSENDESKVEEKKITAEEMTYEEYEKMYEAETGELKGSAEVKTDRDGYTGEGYVSGLNEDGDGWEIPVIIPVEQFYNITVTVAYNGNDKNALFVNDKSLGDFTITDEENFVKVKYENVFLSKGDMIFTLQKTGMDVDSVLIESSDEVNKMELAITDGKLSNENAGDKTQKLYKYLCDNFGKNILTAQYDSCGTVNETSKINELTGKYPAVRFGDLMCYKDDEKIEKETEYAEKWAKENGITGYMWHWNDPVNDSAYYSSDTSFDLSKAVTDEDIANLSMDEIEDLKDDDKLSTECVEIIRDIDEISEILKKFGDLPILWRPLHEASNGYFWWGHDADSYKWLWNLLYKRQTEYHKLNNLIWVWSAQNADWYVGDDMCDIISMDIYDEGNLSGHAGNLLYMHKICSTKPIAISECGTLPKIQNAVNEKAMWSYVCQWGENFLLNDDGEINEDNNSKEDIIEFYNNNITITRDKLADLSTIE